MLQQIKIWLIKEKRKVIYFAIVGLLTAAIYFALIALLLNLLHVNYKWAAMIAYPLAIAFNFSMNRNVTFNNREALLPQLIRYLVMVFVNYLITLAIIIFSVSILGLSPYLGALNAILVTTIIGFMVSKLWVFKSITI